jgi:hypothetical protein
MAAISIGVGDMREGKGDAEVTVLLKDMISFGRIRTAWMGDRQSKHDALPGRFGRSPPLMGGFSGMFVQYVCGMNASEAKSMREFPLTGWAGAFLLC